MLILEDAACIDADINLFFPAAEIRAEGRKRRSRANYEKARLICNGCIDKDLCLGYALRHNVHFGMWGGKTPRERNVIRQEQRKMTSGGDSSGL